MDKKLHIGKSFKITMYILIAIGVVAIVAGFLSGEGERAWANLLLNNFLFLSLALGALFWMALQAITQSGWSAAFVRIPQAMTSYVMVSALLWIVLYFGLPHLFHWVEESAHDPVLIHKSPYLNVPFLIGRTVLFFILWIWITQRIRTLSVKEDTVGGLDSFNKIEFLSKVFIFVLGISFIFVGIDWVMSLDAHWYSTLFSIKLFVSAFIHGSALVALFVLVLNRYGYFPFLSSANRHNFSKYMFMLSIMWGYMWFMQYFLIWYGNLPEETEYYHVMREQGFQGLFLAEIFINWFFPFIFLMWNRIAKNGTALIITAVVLLIGQYIEIYNAVMPHTVHKTAFGFTEIGSYLGFAGLFLFTVVTALSKHALIPKNHPYLQESIHDGEH